VSDQLKLFSEFELPIAVRPHRFLNFEQSRWTRVAAELAVLRREHIANCKQFLREASMAYMPNDQMREHWAKMEEAHRSIDEVERWIVAKLGLIERDRIAYVERMLVKIRGEL
jgi:hypothetical protein